MSSIGSVGGFRPPPSRPSFEKLDGDSNGALSLEEFKSGAPKGADGAKSEELFKAIDTDSDGSVSKDESDAFKSKVDTARQQLQSFLFGLQSGGTENASGSEDDDIFAQIDADSNGGVSKDEFLDAFSASGTSKSNDRLSKLFEALDADADGSISKDEQQAFQKAAQERRQDRGPPPSSIALEASQAYGSSAQLASQPRASLAAYAQAA